MLKTIIALLSLLGGVGRFIPVAWLGVVLGPVGPFVVAVLGFIAQMIKWFFEGLTVIVSRPVTFVTVGMLATACFAGGVRLGIKWDAHLVAKKEAVIVQMIEDGKKADATNKDKFDKAVAAAVAARAAEIARGKSVDVPIRPAEPKRVRKPAAGKSGDKNSGPGLFGIFGL